MDTDKTAPTGELKKKHILIIEDDTFLVKTYQLMLEREGFIISVATDGKVAMAMLLKPPADLVLLDLMLPQVSGFEVLSAIQKDAKWKRVPIIILTNLGQAEDIDRGRELGVAKYIIKAHAKIADIVKEVKAIVA